MPERMNGEPEGLLEVRLRAALDAVPERAPDPARARYRATRPVRPRALGPAFGFAAGVLVTAAFLGVISPLPARVWLERAAGGVQRIEDRVLPAAGATPSASLTGLPTPRPAASEPGRETGPAGPAAAPTADADEGEGRAEPAATASPEGVEGGDRDAAHEGVYPSPGPSPSPSSSARPSPTPSSRADGR